jgi:sulfide dehydrogenase [flavocytochrome c] flavoprotein subunit
MGRISRRQFSIGIGQGLLAGKVAGWLGTGAAFAQGKGRVVIIGGGAGGATVAHYVKKGAPELEVTLIEARPVYRSCFFSNLYIGGFRSFESLEHNYDGLKNLGVRIINAAASDVDGAKRRVRLEGGDSLDYDKLVLSPGIALKYSAIEGYSPEAAEKMPHAYLGAGAQTQTLVSQLQAMDDGGLVVLAAPPDPFRCPPGPYERVSMIAHYLKMHKPKSKIAVLDAKSKFSKQSLFQEAWLRLYPGMIEWLPTELSEGGARRVDASAMEVISGAGEVYKAAVACIIPAQKAGEIAVRAGCADGDWCPVDFASFASKSVPDIYVLGDAAIASPMPKSAFSANNQAKVVANSIMAELAGKEKFPAHFRNTCWSMLAPDNSVKIGANYLPAGNELQAADSFISAPGEALEQRAETYRESVAWYASITADIFAEGEC